MTDSEAPAAPADAAPVTHGQAVVPLGNPGTDTAPAPTTAPAGEPGEPDHATDGGSFYAERAAVRSEVGEALADGILTMQADFPDETRALRAEWRGSDMVENIGYARSFYETVATPELTALLETVDANGRQLGNSPALLKLAARLGRQMKHGGIGDPRMTETDMPSSRAEAASLEHQHSDLTRRIHAAQDEGDHDAANRLAAERSALSRRMGGR